MKIRFPFELVLAAVLLLVAVFPAAAQTPAASPPFLVPPPKPEKPVPLPPAPPPLALRSSGNVTANVIPQVEVWHNNSRGPQQPGLRGRRFEMVYLIETQKAMVRLKFPAAAAGSTVVIKAGPGVALDPPQSQFQIGPGGQCVFSLALDSNFAQTSIEVYYLGTGTRLPLSRASAAIVAAQEARTGGRP